MKKQLFILMNLILLAFSAFAQSSNNDALSEYKARQQKLQQNKEYTKEVIRKNAESNRKAQSKAKDQFNQQHQQAVEDYFSGKTKPIYDPAVIDMNPSK